MLIGWCGDFTTTMWVCLLLLLLLRRPTYSRMVVTRSSSIEVVYIYTYAGGCPLVGRVGRMGVGMCIDIYIHYRYYCYRYTHIIMFIKVNNTYIILMQSIYSDLH